MLLIVLKGYTINYALSKAVYLKKLYIYTITMSL